jgi:hypothetical protein
MTSFAAAIPSWRGVPAGRMVCLFVTVGVAITRL